MGLGRRPTSQTLSKVFQISNATAPIPLKLSKALTILSDTTVRTSTVKKTWHHMEIQEKLHVSRADQQAY